MDTIIGLGAAGCKIADHFSKYPQYEIYKIDSQDFKDKNCFVFPKHNTPELYEKNCPDLSVFFKNISGDVLFVMAGSGKITGATLAILKQLTNCNINILYIQPTALDLTATGKLQNRLTFNVLQEYARSGMIDKIFLIANDKLEINVGDVPITHFKNKINSLLVDTIHYINYFKNTEPVLDNSQPPRENSRIATFGVYDMSSKQESVFFDLQFIKDKNYYFGISESAINNDGKLLKNIREDIFDKNIQVSYQIHQTNYENNICYFTAYSNVIQSLDN